MTFKRAESNPVYDPAFDAPMLERLIEMNRLEETRKLPVQQQDDEDLRNTGYRTIQIPDAVAYFGLLLGSLGPLSLMKELFGRSALPNDIVFIIVLCFAVFMTAVVGMFTGYAVGRRLLSFRKFGWNRFILSSMLLGLAWGIISGAAGGVFIFLIGGIVGAIFGGLSGFFAFTLFAVAYRLLSGGHSIQIRHYLPISLGTVLTVCAFFLGF
ncbi:hypothetical protein [Leptolyngbya sp. 7M]|uniref:hypothetical protein n=1 Tax=Leptolyngbya sp. 7M TaxID=2812896 RepID=UPI001B8D8107|nr:hypothetical protein [Leptolyngbya sp. 7M]QYO66912.1 hypothetical protein JVX88_08945 [Leptolyngbya sp. 7M]